MLTCRCVACASSLLSFILYSVLAGIKALAHLMGGGFVENILRVLPENLKAEIQLGSWPLLPLWKLIHQKGNITFDEILRVFNMGISMLVIVDKGSVAKIQKLIREKTLIIGELVEGNQKVELIS